MGLRLVGTLALVTFFANSLHAELCSPSQVESSKKVVTAAYRMMKQTKGMKERKEFAKIISNSMKDCALNFERAGVPEKEIKGALCHSVDLRSKMGPIRNQDGVGWCYAFTAADMLSFKTGGKPRVSAAELANQKIAADPQMSQASQTAWLSSERYAGGYISETLKIAAKNGVCSEKQIASEVNGGPEISQAYHDLYASAYYRNQYKSTSLCESMATKYRNFFPGTSPSEILKIIHSEQPYRVVQKIFEKSCPQKTNLSLSANDIGEELDKKNFAKVLDTELDQGQPVGLGYNIILIAAPRGLTNNAHASTIAGRRFDAKSGKCQYLLRNSWGRSCDGYRKWPCEAGNLWINEDALVAHSYSTTYFK